MESKKFKNIKNNRIFVMSVVEIIATLCENDVRQTNCNTQSAKEIKKKNNNNYINV